MNGVRGEPASAPAGHEIFFYRLMAGSWEYYRWISIRIGSARSFISLAWCLCMRHSLSFVDSVIVHRSSSVGTSNNQHHKHKLPHSQ